MPGSLALNVAEAPKEHSLALILASSPGISSSGGAMVSGPGHKPKCSFELKVQSRSCVNSRVLQLESPDSSRICEHDQ